MGVFGYLTEIVIRLFKCKWSYGLHELARCGYIEHYHGSVAYGGAGILYGRISYLLPCIFL